MSAVPIPEDNLLRTQITDAQQKLQGLEQNLRAIDDELDGLAAQREQFELLEQVCGSLEKLDELGAAELFWGGESRARSAQHVREVRSRLGIFQGRLGAIESRRHAVLDEIKEGQEVLDILEEDLFELEREAEERLLEWVPEREPAVVPERPIVMPWSRGGEDDRRFRKSLGSALLAAVLLGAIVPWIDLPLPDFEVLPEVPERFANLIRQQELPPPPPPAAIEEPVPEEDVPEPEPEPVVAEEVPTDVPETPEPAPAAAEEAAPEQQVRSAGILAFRESFSDLAENRPSARLGADARINQAGEAAVGRTERAMVTSQAPGSSGGINLASLSRDTGGGGGGPGIDGVAVSRVASSIGTAGSSDRPLAGGASAGRTDEEIQIVFDRYKAALYRLYNRELRNDPTLRGQVVLKLTIEPDGSVSLCEVQSSDMNAPALEGQVVERVRTFDFGAKDVPAVTILYPIDFLPAA
ncbi:MAG: AgmX/PglI C-terminal domain-containing protein [Gammaproteobacteria bacterium]|nr:AgmX/PglI C-terminal domain-containing protein [Gammaproteobacteria bacterium]